MSGETLLYLGAVLIAVAVIGAIAALLGFRRESKRLNTALEEEYGKRRR